MGQGLTPGRRVKINPDTLSAAARGPLFFANGRRCGWGYADGRRHHDAATGISIKVASSWEIAGLNGCANDVVPLDLRGKLGLKVTICHPAVCLVAPCKLPLVERAFSDQYPMGGGARRWLGACLRGRGNADVRLRRAWGGGVRRGVNCDDEMLLAIHFQVANGEELPCFLEVRFNFDKTLRWGGRAAQGHRIEASPRHQLRVPNKRNAL